MNREEALALVGQRVAAWTAANGVYVGTLEEVVARRGSPWRGRVQIDGVLKPAQHFERGAVMRRGLRQGEPIEVGGANIKPTQHAGTDYLTALKTDLKWSVEQLRARPLAPDAWVHREFIKALEIAMESEQARLDGKPWALRQPRPPENLQELRQAAADAAYERYDFGDGVGVESQSGWEYVSPGREMTRPVFVRFEDDPEPGSVKVFFTVTFKAVDSAELISVEAMTNNGNHLGHLPAERSDTPAELGDTSASPQGDADGSDGNEPPRLTQAQATTTVPYSTTPEPGMNQQAILDDLRAIARTQRAHSPPRAPRKAAADPMSTVQQNGYAIEYLTAEQRTPEVCMAAVRQNGWAIQFLTAEQRTPEVCMAAVQRDGSSIIHLTDEQRTPEVCMAAVRQEGWAIRFLTAEEHTPEVCMAAVQQRGEVIRFLEAVQRTPEVFMAAVQQNGWAIEYLTDEQRAPEVCMAAVQQDGLAIRRLTDEQRTPEVCMAAVQQNGWAIEYLTAEQRTPEVCMAAVQQNGMAIEYLTAEQRTPEVWLQALSQDLESVRFLKAYNLKPQGTAADALKDLLLRHWPEVQTKLPEQTKVAVAKVLLEHAEAAGQAGAEQDSQDAQDSSRAERPRG